LTTIASRNDRSRATRLASSPAATGIARKLVHAAARRGAGGTLRIEEGGRTVTLGQGEPVVSVRVNDPRAYSALLQLQSVGLGEAYAAGWWESDDVTGFIRLLYHRTLKVMDALDSFARATSFRDRFSGAAPGPPDDKRNIHAHYDVSNDFYELMLDKTMMYSCGIFDTGAGSLQEAQEAKLDRICDKLALGPDDHLVEIGTGWGGLSLHAARRHGCRVTTTTISEAQRRYAEKRVADAGLPGLIEIVDKDWRDLDGKYSKLVSVEMIEAVDWRNHGEFLRKCSDLLQADGLGVIQAIVIEAGSFDRAKHSDDFIRDTIFPASCLPSVASLAKDLIGTDLTLVGLDDIGPNYAKTLSAWRDNLAANAEAVAKLELPQEFHRIWHLYLGYCEAAFLEGHVSDVQLMLAKPGWRFPDN
jgi:cyclopropane-fatty-acyl-phospholipid synthase